MPKTRNRHKIWNILLNKTRPYSFIHTVFVQALVLNQFETDVIQLVERSHPNKTLKTIQSKFKFNSNYSVRIVRRRIMTKTDILSQPISDFRKILPNKLMFENNQVRWNSKIFIEHIFLFSKTFMILAQFTFWDLRHIYWYMERYILMDRHF